MFLCVQGIVLKFREEILGFALKNKPQKIYIQLKKKKITELRKIKNVIFSEFS